MEEESKTKFSMNVEFSFAFKIRAFCFFRDFANKGDSCIIRSVQIIEERID